MQSFTSFFVLFCVCCCSLMAQATFIRYDKESISASLVTDDKVKDDIVRVDLFYETLCPHCQNFYSGEFNRTSSLWFDRLDINTVPYGKATRQRSYNGTFHFECQHGERECYGNKLHGCLLKRKGRHTLDVIHFVACMESLRDNGDVDEHADKCGRLHNIDTKPLKACAKGEEGDYIMWLMGAWTEAVKLQWVPHVLVNGVHVEYTQYVQHVCGQFKNPPPECNKL